MAFTPQITLFFLLISLSAELAKGSEAPSEVGSSHKREVQTYIVHVKKLESHVSSHRDDEVKSYHQSFLPAGTAVAASGSKEERLIYSYRHVISGFAARLSEEEVEAMKQKDGFLSARPERMYRLQTTHSPTFLGLHRGLGLWEDSNFGEGVIVGVLDGGVFPNHPSFGDEGMPPPPARWKGKCEFNASDCNKKLIGARSFDLAARAKGLGAEPPVDDDGHGTHTASTAAGAFVQNANALGNANGTAGGIAPRAHLAIYKVCFGPDCPDANVLAGLDAAVSDGVDVLSISLVDASQPLFQDNIAIGSFEAIRRGIFVSCSAGNSGPFEGTLSNEAPWILTVGASTIDRRIVATVKLGNGEEFDGESLFQPHDFPERLLPLVYSGSNGKPDSAFCGEGALNGTDVKGKVVLCERGGGIARISKGVEVKDAGGAAMILINGESDGFSTSADAHVLPASHVSYAAGLRITSYLNSTRTPAATVLFKGTAIGDSLAPVVASFSSRGPNLASPGILKPDIIGPGVSIIAAWNSPLDSNDNTLSNSFFNVMSGTSMSCPHLSGVAALLKSSHPHWSPAAIKSALMTSADLLNLQGKPILDQTLHTANAFATGAGHVNPSKANDPGLVYDIQPDDYIPYLCGLGYTDQQVTVIAHTPINCTEVTTIPQGQLNYPSFSVSLGPPQTFTRTVTNVGEAYSSYSAKVVAPRGVNVIVKPDKLVLSKVNQKATYSVTFSSKGEGTDKYAQGYLEWTSSKHLVRSVIAVSFE
ncbi:subtilisin-like protease 4 [Diospyros lotus]|uniref:subtilisin-like protease 4 n=1 Tax=Diospyros lotus TaxID=55363 RepID=UPI002257EB00|nr:subtilisin-like protease 4 [Diospyros lotus]